MAEGLPRELDILTKFINERFERNERDNYERLTRLESDVKADLTRIKHTLYAEETGVTYVQVNIRRSLKSLYSFLSWTSSIVGALVLGAIIWIVSTTASNQHTYEQIQRIYEQVKPLLPPQHLGK